MTRTAQNLKKDKQLGMSHGTAGGRLRKSVMFWLVCLAGRDWCFQCGEQIETESCLSIEHKKPWLDSIDPVGMFFDINNIAFSHLSCNIKAGRKTNRKYSNKREVMDANNKAKREKRVLDKIKDPKKLKIDRRAKYLRTGT